MSQEILAPLRPFNNDRMATLTAFRSASQAVQVARQRHADASASAAPALPPSAPPRPTQLNDTQAEAILSDVQSGAESMMDAHSNLDPQRVARLLGLLD